MCFLAEGIQKFLYPAARGCGRFEGMGFPAPEFFGPFVGGLEIIAGLPILAGLATRLGAFITFSIMLIAIIVTKIPILFGEAFGPFQVRELSTYGFWAMAHEMRTDFAMFLGSLFLIIKGGGRWSLDSAWFSYNK
ncbi:DoxX family protein [Aliifodinibius salipaludis]|uniref:DoxX family protein n=1 Tax=Fodinibius salipaludis TaxID=2032627 RepID=UPI001C3F07B4|nr:DoxX family protein [Aliifodinibius salipaludis]